MGKNNLYFLKIWGKTLIIVIPIILSLLYGISQNANNVKQIILAIIIVGIISYFFRNNTEKSIEKCFQCETSKQLLDYYNNIMKSKSMDIKDRDAMIVYCKSLSCCYYGEFDKVEQMLREITWNDRSPYIQSLETSLKALRCYLESKNYKDGLRLSIISKDLGVVSDKIPGSKKNKNFYETYVQVGELLSGNIQNDIIESLEIKLDKSPIFIKILISHSLSKVYMQLNRIEKAKEKIDYCKQVAPHCKPLFE